MSDLEWFLFIMVIAMLIGFGNRLKAIEDKGKSKKELEESIELQKKRDKGLWKVLWWIIGICVAFILLLFWLIS